MSRRDRPITADELMSMTNNGLDIFHYELGNIDRRKIFSPLRNAKSKTFEVRQNRKGVWIGIDYNGSFSGNAINFVMERYGLNFPQAIEKVCNDLEIRRNNIVYTPKVVQNVHEFKEHIPMEFDVSVKPFEKVHHNYWNRAGISEDFLRKHSIYALDKFAINRTVQKPTEGEYGFVYVAEDTGLEKILRLGPNVLPENKWRSQMQNNFLWNLYKYKNKKVDNMFIVKSRKDEIILHVLGYDACSVQHEEAATFLNTYEQWPTTNSELVREICPNPIINFGSDKQGVKESKMITEAIGCRYFNTQKHLESKYGINDNFSFACEFGIETLNKLIQIRLKIKPNE